MLILNRMQALLERRKENQALRVPKNNTHLIDFCSNDYLSLSRNNEIQAAVHAQSKELFLGSTGSRLLSGHYDLIEKLEEKLAYFHQAEAALVFNSGYNANIALLSSLFRRGDILLYDALIHASIHDGMKMTTASTFAFEHNNLEHLKTLLTTHRNKNIFIVVESIYSMDGDEAPLIELANIAKAHNAQLIVDEAHSTGVCGENGAGLCVQLGIEKLVFARLHTFGKAIGAHGAAILGSKLLKDYLINFARPLIYTTALSPHTALSVLTVYQYLEKHGNQAIQELNAKINHFRTLILPLVQDNYIHSHSSIQTLIVPGNEKVVALAQQLEKAGMDARPIRTPTVPAGKERIRICLHCHNSFDEIKQLVHILFAQQ